MKVHRVIRVRVEIRDADTKAVTDIWESIALGDKEEVENFASMIAASMKERIEEEWDSTQLKWRTKNDETGSAADTEGQPIKKG